MSKKKQRQLFIMLIVLAVLVVLLAGGILLNKWNTQRKEEAEDAATPRVVTMEDVTGLTLTNGGESLSFALDEDGSWYWTEDAEFPLDDSVCAALASLAEEFTADQQMDILDDLAAYGLEEPAQKLTLTDGSGESTTILVGIQTGDLYYAMVEGGDQIYTIDSTLPDNLSLGLYDMAQLADYPALSSDIMQSASIQGQNTEEFTIKEVEVEAESDTEDGNSSASAGEPEVTTEYHWFRSDGSDVTEESLVTSLRTELDTIAVDSLAYFKPTGDERAACGLEAPTAVVTVRYTQDGEEKTSVLTIGGYEEASDSYYCTLDTNPDEIYLITADTVENSVEIAEKGFEAASAETQE